MKDSRLCLKITYFSYHLMREVLLMCCRNLQCLHGSQYGSLPLTVHDVSEAWHSLRSCVCMCSTKLNSVLNVCTSSTEMIVQEYVIGPLTSS